MYGYQQGSRFRRLKGVLVVWGLGCAAGAWWVRRNALAEPTLPSAFYSAAVDQTDLRVVDGRFQSIRTAAVNVSRRLRRHALHGCSAALRGLDWLGLAVPPLESSLKTVKKVLGYLAIQIGLTAPYRLKSSYPMPELRQRIEEKWSGYGTRPVETHRLRDSLSVDLYIVGDTPDCAFQLATAAARAYPAAVAWAQTGTLPPPTSSRAETPATSARRPVASSHLPVPVLRLHLPFRDFFPPGASRDMVQILIRAGRVINREHDWLGLERLYGDSGTHSGSDVPEGRDPHRIPRGVCFDAAFEPAKTLPLTAAIESTSSARRLETGDLSKSPTSISGTSIRQDASAGCTDIQIDQRSRAATRTCACTLLGKIDLTTSGLDLITAVGSTPVTSPLDDALRLHQDDFVTFDRLLDTLCNFIETIQDSVAISSVRAPSARLESSRHEERSLPAPVVLVFHACPPDFAIASGSLRTTDTDEQPFITGREIGSLEDLDPEEWAEFSQRLTTAPLWRETGPELAKYWRLATLELLERLAHVYPQQPMEACDGRVSESIPPSTVFVGRAPGALGLALVNHLAKSS
jgi:hypothetical protein